MERRKNVIRVVVGNGIFGKVKIGPLFQYSELLKQYFSISPEIPARLMKLEIARGHRFWLVLEEQPREHDQRVRIPTIEETLWTAGLMAMDFSAIVCERPVRFPHKPFRVPGFKRSDPEALRHVIVRRSPTGYSTETIAASAGVSGEFLAYVINTSFTGL